ncbi:MAG: hypothetical protein R2854_18285 [Caldilineaceae bacterium]
MGHGSAGIRSSSRTRSSTTSTTSWASRPEQKFVSDEELAPGKYTLGVEFIRESAGEYHESHGTAKLYIDDKVVAEGPMRTQTGKFTLCGDGLCVGRDSADAVVSTRPRPQASSPATPSSCGGIGGEGAVS